MLELLEPVRTPFSGLHDQINQLFEDFYRDAAPQWGEDSNRFPAVNIWDDGEAAHLEAELPGVKLEQVEVLVSGNELRLTVRREGPANGQHTWHRRERLVGSFTRAFTLPWELNPDQVEARLKNGVLTVNLLKAQSAKPRKIKLLTQ